VISPSTAFDILTSGWFLFLLIVHAVVTIVGIGLVVHALFDEYAPPLPEKEEGDWFFDHFTT
jgi:hypothetical protein